jgi:hypothetical protein
MTATREDRVAVEDGVTQDCTLVWIDAREAVIARWQEGEAHLERLHSDVPSHHRATGHVHYDPTVGHGGLAPKDAGERKRLEHLARFVELVATKLPATDELVIIGPGTVRDRLAHRVREADRHASRAREVRCEAAARLTDRQIVARLRHVAGSEQRRWIAGAYRTKASPTLRPSGSVRPESERGGPKPSSQIDTKDLIEEETE